MGKTALSSHMKGTKHAQRMKFHSNGEKPLSFFFNKKESTSSSSSRSSLPGPSSSSVETAAIDSSSSPTTSTSSSRSIKQFVSKADTLKAEIWCCVRSAMKNHSFSSNSDLGFYLKNMFPNVPEVNALSLGKTKSMYMTVYGLARHFKSILLKDVQPEPFCMLFDESLNKSTMQKQLDDHVRYWSNISVPTRYVDSFMLGHATANDLVENLSTLKRDLNFANLLQMSMDGPNVNWCAYEKFGKQLTTDYGTGLINIGSCGLHQVHNSYRAAVNATTWGIDHFLNSVYILLKNVPARRSDFITTTNSSIFPLKFAAHRWVENQRVLIRAKEIVAPLQLYVQAVQKKKVKNPATQSYTSVMKFLEDKLLMPKSGTKWTHVSCALWIPEVSIGCPEKMEPITKISNIPPSRWALVCCLCKERVGACIQCSVKQCKTAFHVTCGFSHNLDMKTIVDDSDDSDGIHLRAYCPKHTKNRHASDSESPKKEECMDNENDISEAEMAKKRMEKLKQLEEEFYTLVDIHEIANKFFIPEEAVDIVAEYWKLKRKVNNNKPLITPKMEEEDQMQKQQKDSLSARMKMFVHLRQDLERARNLCYMISKREKTKRQLFKLKESVFRAQIRVLTDPYLSLSARDAEKIRQDYHFDSIYSNYGVLSPRSNKQPRENLFTLENLKTPKDFAESGDENQISDKVSTMPVTGGNEDKQRDRELVRGGETSADSASVSEQEKCRDNLFSVSSFKIREDSTAESSDNETLASLANCSQMSRLGKVKLKEIEEKKSDGEAGDIITVPETPTKKFVPSSDLRKKLTSILQSKSMMQQRHEKSHAGIMDSVNETLHVDIENSDSDVFTSDTNADLTSPADQPRNLFDHFGLQGKSVLSSPDLPTENASNKQVVRSRRLHKKSKKRKHSRSPHKHKKTGSLISPSDQSSISSATVKTEATPSDETDQVSTVEAGHLLSDDTDHSLVSPVPTSERAEVDQHTCKHSSRSFSRSGRSKRKKSRRNRDNSKSPGRSLHSTLKLPQLSPSPRVDPENVYAHLDGDIYVPSGKIQVTERTIKLDDPKDEERNRVGSKLKLKKQTNSPVKGIVSYEVVKDEDDRLDIFEDKRLKTEPVDSKNIFDRVLETATSHSEVSDKAESEVSTHSQRSLRKHKPVGDVLVQKVEDSVGPRTRQKTQEESDQTVTEIKEEKEEETPEVSVKRNLFGASSRRGRRRGRSLVPATSEHDEDVGNTSDENFRPKGGTPKSQPVNKSPRPRRIRRTRQFHANDTDGDDESDDFTHNTPTRRKSTQNSGRMSSASRGVKLKPLPNKPELTALLDSSKLVVKDELRKEVGDRLGRMFKHRGRWGNVARDHSQTTLDKFIKKSSSSENVFSKADVIKSPNRKLTTSSLTRSDVSPLSVSKSSTVNVNDSPAKSSTLPMSPIKAAAMANNIFGAHSSPRGSLSSYRIPRKSDTGSMEQHITPPKFDTASEAGGDGERLFGEDNKMSGASFDRQLSFEDVSRKSELVEVVKTPSKCDPSELTEDGLDGHRSYRSHSPPSSEGSGASTRILQLDSRESTPSRRVTRSQLHDDSSPLTRTRKREGLLKAPQLKLS